VVEGLEAGADDYLVKPVNLSELRARLHVGVRGIAAGTAIEEGRRAPGDARQSASAARPAANLQLLQAHPQRSE